MNRTERILPLCILLEESINYRKTRPGNHLKRRPSIIALNTSVHQTKKRSTMCASKSIISVVLCNIGR